MNERPEVFAWNWAIEMSNDDPQRATALGLSLVSSQLDRIIELLQGEQHD